MHYSLALVQRGKSGDGGRGVDHAGAERALRLSLTSVTETPLDNHSG